MRFDAQMGGSPRAPEKGAPDREAEGRDVVSNVKHPAHNGRGPSRLFLTLARFAAGTGPGREAVSIERVGPVSFS
jgi:hypothetical protein